MVKAAVYVSVFSERRTRGGLSEEVDNGTYARDVVLAAVPRDGDLLDYNDCGKRVGLGRVRSVVHVAQPDPSPFKEPDEPRVEVVTRLLSEEPENDVETLKDLVFHEVR